ncbi:acyltransferase [Curvibacter sp. HBC61]|uniref:Acyltransferase n=1 Tax=Curvibacter cyanobacteriorum TaxID=3026422 RepID=A0ABT5N3V4_9BURK|nr:acyltransferase [Curvibacter sp. HBC61]MDD0840990.1 acyltransferase [Curvibacter sp. HBC61]
MANATLSPHRTTPPAAPGLPHFAALDSLRALAAGLVFLYHFHVLEPGSGLSLFTHLPVLQIGWIGVDLFLLISGFVITRSGLSQNALSTPQDRRQFMVRRLARIVPLYLVTSVFWLVWVDPSPVLQGWSTTLMQIGSHLVFLHNLWPSTHGSINGPTWSIALEMQFYVFIALTLRFMPRGAPWKWLLGLMLLAWAFKWAVALGLRGADNAVPLMVIYSGELPGTLDEFGLGIFLALMLHRQPGWLQRWSQPAWRHCLLWLALFGLGFNACVQVMAHHGDYWGNAWMVVFWKTGLVVSFFFLLLAALSVPGGVQGLLKPLNYLGQISYGIYLWHMPVLKLWQQSGTLHGGPLLAAVTGCTLALAVLTWHGLERPLSQALPRLPWIQRWCQGAAAPRRRHAPT